MIKVEYSTTIMKNSLDGIDPPRVYIDPGFVRFRSRFPTPENMNTQLLKFKKL